MSNGQDMAGASLHSVGDTESVLSTNQPSFPFVRQLISELFNDAISYENSGNDSVVQILQSAIYTSKELAASHPTTALQIAHAFCDEFIRQNYVGPQKPLSSLDELMVDEAASKRRSLLILGEGDAAYRLCKYPQLLIVSQCLLRAFLDQFASDVSAKFLLLKVTWLQQSLLDERSPALAEKSKSLITDIVADQELQASEESYVEFLLIASHISQFYLDHLRAKELLDMAADRTDVRPVLTGILGKRTKFQEISYAQLVVNVGNEEPSKNPPSLMADRKALGFPQDIRLEDDTLFGEYRVLRSCLVRFADRSSVRRSTVHMHPVEAAQSASGTRRRGDSGISPNDPAQRSEL